MTLNTARACGGGYEPTRHVINIIAQVSEGAAAAQIPPARIQKFLQKSDGANRGR